MLDCKCFCDLCITQMVRLRLKGILVKNSIVELLCFSPNICLISVKDSGNLFPFCECWWSGGDTQNWWGHLTLLVVIELIWTFCTQRWIWKNNLIWNCPWNLSRPLHHSWGGGVTLTSLTPLARLRWGGVGASGLKIGPLRNLQAKTFQWARGPEVFTAIFMAGHISSHTCCFFCTYIRGHLQIHPTSHLVKLSILKVRSHWAAVTAKETKYFFFLQECVTLDSVELFTWWPAAKATAKVSS